MLRPILLAALALGLAGAPAFADKPAHPGKGKGHDRGRPEENEGRGVGFSDHDRELVRVLLVEQYGRGNCPPGLAKKNNGCLPPGQAKKRYTVGRALPVSVVVQPLPAPLEARLGAAPPGYRYAIVDGDVVKLAVGTKLVVDAIRALVH
jgi:hypothetical protein